MKVIAIVLLMAGTAAAQCGVASVRGGWVSGSGGFIVQQSQPSGLLGKRTKTRTTVVLPIGQPVAQCPPCPDDDDDNGIQTELLRQIITLLKNRETEEAIEDQSRENRQLMLMLLEVIRNQRTGAEAIIMPQTTKWSPSSR